MDGKIIQEMEEKLRELKRERNHEDDLKGFDVEDISLDDLSGLEEAASSSHFVVPQGDWRELFRDWLRTRTADY